MRHWQALELSPTLAISISPLHELSFMPDIFASDSDTVTSGPSTSTSHSDFASIFNAALGAYKCKTNYDLASHPLLPKLQSCDSPQAILAVLREQIPAQCRSQNGDEPLIKSVTPAVDVLHSFSFSTALTALGGDVGPVNIGMFTCEYILL